MTTPLKIAFIGECMIERSGHSDNIHYAGDSFNTAYYCKKIAGEAVDVQYVTALGFDDHSLNMLHFFKSKHIGCDYIRQIKDKAPGSYTIHIDSQGERSFTYDRDQAAVKCMFDNDELLNRLSDFDVIYFSGITLAILSDEVRLKFLDVLKNVSAKIIFDTNYRPRLWPSKEKAKQTVDAFLKQVDIALPSFDDEQNLYSDNSLEETADRLLKHGITEVIVKNGAEGYLIATPDNKTLVAIEPIKNVVDTTAAGDSFDGAYLAKRLAGSEIKEAAEKAAQVAAQVIQQYGAIV